MFAVLMFFTSRRASRIVSIPLPFSPRISLDRPPHELFRLDDSGRGHTKISRKGAKEQATAFARYIRDEEEFCLMYLKLFARGGGGGQSETRN